jgi:hypothetical protein
MRRAAVVKQESSPGNRGPDQQLSQFTYHIPVLFKVHRKSDSSELLVEEYILIHITVKEIIINRDPIGREAEKQFYYSSREGELY